MISHYLSISALAGLAMFSTPTASVAAPSIEQLMSVIFFDDAGELTRFEGDFEQTPENLQFPQQAQSAPASPAPER